jgi:REP element-mobilizing transposase RayT
LRTVGNPTGVKFSGGRERIRTIIRQVCKELGVQIVSGVLSKEHVHMFVEIPPHIAVSVPRDNHSLLYAAGVDGRDNG